MTMTELAEEYLYSAQLLSGQIEELLAYRRTLKEPVTIRRVNIRLRSLREMRLENRSIADHLLHYYDKGGHRYEEYGV